MQCHPVISEVASLVDLQHYCGVISLIRTGYTVAHHRSTSGPRLPLENDANETEDNSATASPLESHDKLNREALGLDLSEQEMNNLESEWTLLDLSFGIPLFNDALNKDVCQRMAFHGLCHKENLEELLHSSRRLTLELLKFISEYQVNDKVYLRVSGT